MRSDVKAVRQTVGSTGVIFAGRTRLRGIIIESTDAATAGSVVLQDNTDSTTLFSAGVPAGDVFSFNMPEDGILFPGGLKVSAFTSLTAATILLDK